MGAYAPTGPETTAVQFSRCALSKALEERDLERISYFDNVLGPEDFAICESVQRGLHARCYTQGRFIVDHDRTDILATVLLPHGLIADDDGETVSGSLFADPVNMFILVV